MAGEKDVAPPLHVFFLPYLSPGHMLPMVDMARCFAEHGARCSIVTTPGNMGWVGRSVEGANGRRSGRRIELLEMGFPSDQVGLPEGWENLTCFPTPGVTDEFHAALGLLRHLFDQLLREHHPDCVVSDVHFAWTAESSLAMGIPRLVFPGIGSFAATVSGQIRRYRPHEEVSDEDEAFVVPGLPHRIELRRSQLPEYLLGSYDMMDRLGVANSKSYGVLMNTFVELEEGYIQEEWPPKLWYVGPLSLCNRDLDDRALRGHAATPSSIGRLSWLDAKTPGSVLYVCFGSMGRFTPAQLREIAVALEASGHPYVWVIQDHVDPPKRSPAVTNGLIMVGWAPQILILNHEAVGGFLTHCGWNSCLESICAGVPMVTWPLYAEQFLNERLVVDVLKVGVGVGGGCRCSNHQEERGLVRSPEIMKAVAEVMGDKQETRSIRERAEELSVMAARAVEEGGSSYTNMASLIDDLVGHKKKAQLLEEKPVAVGDFNSHRN